MTNKEMEQARLYIQENFDLKSEEYKILENELNCISMINSGLAYGTEKDFYDETTKTWGRYSKSFIDFLGEKRVKELWDNQLKDFKNAEIIKAIYTDSDGLAYNQILWADDDKPF